MCIKYVRTGRIVLVPKKWYLVCEMIYTFSSGTRMKTLIMYIHATNIDYITRIRYKAMHARTHETRMHTATLAAGVVQLFRHRFYRTELELACNSWTLPVYNLARTHHTTCPAELHTSYRCISHLTIKSGKQGKLFYNFEIIERLNHHLNFCLIL